MSTACTTTTAARTEADSEVRDDGGRGQGGSDGTSRGKPLSSPRFVITSEQPDPENRALGIARRCGCQTAARRRLDLSYFWRQARWPDETRVMEPLARGRVRVMRSRREGAGMRQGSLKRVARKPSPDDVLGVRYERIEGWWYAISSNRVGRALSAGGALLGSGRTRREARSDLYVQLAKAAFNVGRRVRLELRVGGRAISVHNPDFPGPSGHGRTPREARLSYWEALRDFAEAHAKSERARGRTGRVWPVPQPPTRLSSACRRR
jgi:hypothetical protein